MITERPAEVADRAIPGHWEGEMLIELSFSVIGTLVELATRFTMLMHLSPTLGHGAAANVKNGPAFSGHGSQAVRDAISLKISTLPDHLAKSLTWDQGAEVAQHAHLRIETGLEIYLYDPKSSWQRGTNENMNELLRQYFPTGTDMSWYNERELDAAAATLDGRPRKTLCWRTPAEALSE